MSHTNSAGNDPSPVRPDAATAAPGHASSAVTLAMVLTAVSGVLLVMLCVDATACALVWAMLEMVGAGTAVIGWVEAVLVGASLVPAALLFRRALASERALRDGGMPGAG